MKCEQCFHEDVCLYGIAHAESVEYAKAHAESVEYAKAHGTEQPVLICGHFKDKDLIVELPCKLGDTLYFIEHKWESGNNTRCECRCTDYEEDNEECFPHVGFICKKYGNKSCQIAIKTAVVEFLEITDNNHVVPCFISQHEERTAYTDYYVNKEEAEKALKERETQCK